MSQALVNCFSIDFIGFELRLERERNLAQQAGRRGENVTAPIFYCKVSLLTFPRWLIAGSACQPREEYKERSTRRFDRKTWILASSPVFSRGVQHLMEHSQQTEREVQSKSSLAFCLGWLFQPVKPSPRACPYLEGGSAELHPFLGFTRSFWGRVYHLGGATSYAAVWLRHIKPTGTQALKNNICARHSSTRAGCARGYQSLLPCATYPPMPLQWVKGHWGKITILRSRTSSRNERLRR